MDDKLISRRSFLRTAAAGGLMGALGCNLRYKVSSVVGNYGFPRKPNVILVMSNDQGYANMGCHGNDVVKTPNIDRFYEESSRFDKFFVSPLVRHTQASVLTGRNVPVSGGLSKEDVLLTEVLSSAGYNICTDVFFDAAMRFIEEDRDAPFFCYLSTNASDLPYEVDEKYSAPYMEQGFGEDVANFYGMIANLDENFGRLLARVKELGLEEETLIIFMTADGSAMGDKAGLFNAGFRGGKGSVYEGGSRGACFWRMPGTLRAGKVVEQMGMHYDIVPSLAEICDARHPNPERLEGMNLIPYLVNDKQKIKDRLFVTYPGEGPLGKNRNYSVRTSRFRLVNDTELYDVSANPSETINVIERYPAEVAQIRAAQDR